MLARVFCWGRQLHRCRSAMYNRAMPVDALMFAIYALATARLTGIATGADEITRPYVRVRFTNWINPDDLETGWRHLLAYLAACMWCASIYLGVLAIAPLSYWYGREPWLMVPALGLAYSQITGMTSNWGRD